MSALDNRPNTALLVIDVQNGVVGEAYHRDTIVANVATLVDKARASNVEVVWVQHSDENLPRDTEEWQYVPELVLDDSEPVVHKSYGDSFEDTDLESVLAERRVGRLVVADAHTTEDLSEYGAPTPDKVIAHTNLYWKYHQAPRRTAGTVWTDGIDFAKDITV